MRHSRINPRKITGLGSANRYADGGPTQQSRPFGALRIARAAWTPLFFCCVLTAVPSFADVADIYDYTRRLGQGVNLGNALEAPNEGEWGIVLNETDFQVISEGGFDSVRVPIRWSSHAAAVPDQGVYAIDPSFMSRIDWVVEQAQSRSLAVVLNVHHYDELVDAPHGAHRQRFLSLWTQISERYRDQPNTLYFEILNEPHGATDERAWNSLLNETVSTIRQTNPDRPIIVGGTNWNSYASLDGLELPEDDRNVIGTFHYYSPFQFTHQGAGWVDNSDTWLGTTWTGTEDQKADVERHLDQVVEWATANDRPVYLGEFGAYSRADADSRFEWTKFVAQEAEDRGIPWSYWEFGAGFGVYDRDDDRWNSEIYDALAVNPELPPVESLTSCDFNGDSTCDVIDLDQLTGLGKMSQGVTLVHGVNDPFDLNGDGRLNVLDVDTWLQAAATEDGLAESYRRGDANLDGAIDGTDFNRWNENNFTIDRVWSDGDFDSDGDVDIVDLSVWKRERFTSIPPASQVPEPPWGLPSTILSIGIILFRRFWPGRFRNVP